MSFKQQVYKLCQEALANKLRMQRAALKDLIDSAGNETKSSAGDKFETSRAMLHIEQDNIRKQIAETTAQLTVLDSIDPNSKPEKVCLGSLVATNKGYYFLSTAMGKLSIQDKVVIALSTQSPLGQQLVGLRPGYTIVMNGKEIVIEDIV